MITEAKNIHGNLKGGENRQVWFYLEFCENNNVWQKYDFILKEGFDTARKEPKMVLYSRPLKRFRKADLAFSPQYPPYNFAHETLEERESNRQSNIDVKTVLFMLKKDFGKLNFSN